MTRAREDGRQAMTTQILRTIDRWRFEAPLAAALAASAGFAVLTAPAELFDQLPVAGALGVAGRVIVAVLLAAVCGGLAYWMLRKPARSTGAAAEPTPADPAEDVAEAEQPSGMPAERLARFRRADRHPDAPPREPIIASRDLGQPFMDVGGFAPPPAQHAEDEGWWPEDTIPDGEFVEVEEGQAAAHEGADVQAEAPAPEASSVEAPPTVSSAAPERVPGPASRTSISAMMERLSAGLDRRARETATVPPPRDVSPALRNALHELNRLAERRH